MPTVFRKKKFLLTVIILFVLIILSIAAFKPSHQHSTNPALSVNVGAAITKAMPIYLTAPGFLEPLNATSIQAQVTGTIQGVFFQEGQTVTTGQLLYQIDPAPYQAALRNAQANEAQDVAQLKIDALDQQRYADLIKQNYVSQQQYDQSKATTDAQTAKVAADTAEVHAAQINLDYTSIRAPIAGKISDTLVKVGDFVSPNNSNVLTTIQSAEPLLVDFYLPQHNLRKLLAYQQQNPIQVEVWNEPQTHLLATGTLSFIDNAVDPNTGTVLLKATIPHAVPNLWPGAKVVVKVILTVEPNALVIPSAAVQFGQQGNFVYRIEQNKATRTSVTIDRQIDEWTVISQGLSVGDVVITHAPPTLENHAVVKIVS